MPQLSRSPRCALLGRPTFDGAANF